MSTKDNASVSSTGGLFKRLARKRSSGPGSPITRSPNSPNSYFPSTDAPPWLPPLVDLGQDPATPPPVPYSPTKPTASRSAKTESKPPVLNLPSFIDAPPPPAAKPLTFHAKDGPQLPPVVAVDTSLNLDMTRPGFLAVPEEVGGAAKPIPAPVVAKPKSNGSASNAKPAAAASPPAKIPRSTSTFSSLFRRKPSKSQVDRAAPTGATLTSEMNGVESTLRRNSYTPPAAVKEEPPMKSSASQKLPPSPLLQPAPVAPSVASEVKTPGVAEDPLSFAVPKGAETEVPAVVEPTATAAPELESTGAVEPRPASTAAPDEPSAEVAQDGEGSKDDTSVRPAEIVETM